jgi:hypothetical protein
LIVLYFEISPTQSGIIKIIMDEVPDLSRMEIMRFSSLTIYKKRHIWECFCLCALSGNLFFGIEGLSTALSFHIGFVPE